MRRRATAAATTAWPAAALLAPGLLILLSLFGACLSLLRYSFNDWDPVHTMVPAWTLRKYASLVLDPVQLRALEITLRISLTVACLLLWSYAPPAVNEATSPATRSSSGPT